MTMMFINIRAGLVVSFLMLGFILANFKRVISVLFTPPHRLFLLFVAIELLSFINYVANSEAFFFVSNYPRIISEIFSYIIIPQVFFYWLGSEISTNNKNINLQLKSITLVNIALISICIILHLWVPDFYVEFAKQYFEAATTGQLLDKEIIPRMHGYLNSMQNGVVCSTTIILVAVLFKHKLLKIALILILILGSIFTLQRGSWVACLLAILLLALIEFRNNQFNIGKFIQKNRLEFALFVFVLISGFVFFQTLSDDSGGYAPHLLYRIAEFGDASNERSQQFVDAKIVLEKYPFGIGLGLLTAKATDQGFRYSVPDAIYYRIFAELGYVGGLVFLSFLIGGLVKLYKKGLFYLAAILVVYMFQATGTAVFELYYCSFPFWILMAIAYSKQEQVPMQGQRSIPNVDI